MDIARAFEIVLELARGNLADESSVTRLEQDEAIVMLEDLAVNEFGDE